VATLAELTTRLTNIQLAITAVQSGGQEYKINDQLIETWMRRGDLRALFEEQARLEKRISIISGSGGVIVV